MTMPIHPSGKDAQNGGVLNRRVKKEPMRDPLAIPTGGLTRGPL